MAEKGKTMDELKRCPFCGGSAFIPKRKVGGDLLPWVFCENCGVETEYCETVEEAIKAWNMRADNG